MDFPRILNRPVKLHWAGWETDTLALANAGWELSAQQNYQRDTMMIAINHPKAGIQGISEIEKFFYREFTDQRMGERMPELLTQLRFNNLAREIYIQSMNLNEFAFSPIDCVPRYNNQAITKLSDFAHFTSAEKAKHEVYLHEASINQILEMALTKQAPDQDRIRKEMLQRQAISEMKTGRLHTELRLVA